MTDASAGCYDAISERAHRFPQVPDRLGFPLLVLGERNPDVTMPSGPKA